LYLWNTGQLRFDKEQWLNYCERAKNNETTRLNAKLTEAKNNVNKIAVNEITSELANINGALIQSIARNLAVKDWIEQQLNKG
jgi:mannose-1-phosphate guanylyltransferase